MTNNLCSKCNNKLNGTEKFCPKCGEKIAYTLPSANTYSAKHMTKRKSVYILCIFITVLLIILGIFIAKILIHNSKIREQIDLGGKYLGESEYEQAIIAFEGAYKLNPKDEKIHDMVESAYVEWADSLVEQNEYDKALEVLHDGYEHTKDTSLDELIEDITDKKEEYIIKKDTEYLDMLLQNIKALWPIAQKNFTNNDIFFFTDSNRMDLYYYYFYHGFQCNWEKMMESHDSEKDGFQNFDWTLSNIFNLNLVEFDAKEYCLFRYDFLEALDYYVSSPSVTVDQYTKDDNGRYFVEISMQWSLEDIAIYNDSFSHLPEKIYIEGEIKKFNDIEYWSFYKICEVSFEQSDNLNETSDYAILYLEHVGLDMSYAEMEAICNHLGGHLATITSQEENDYVCDIIRETAYGTEPYFGLSNSKVNWEWVNGETVAYTNWISPYPNSENIQYARFHHQNYNDVYGGWATDSLERMDAYFICEWD